MNIKRFVLPVLATTLICGFTLGMSGCSGPTVSGSLHCAGGSGVHISCSVGVAVGVEFMHSCADGQNCRKYGGMFEEFLVRIGEWTEEILGVQKAEASVPQFDASLVSVNLSGTNIAPTSNAGNVIVSLYNGQTLVAQQEFTYYRSGNSLYATDPGAINAWISSYSNDYDTVQVSNVNSDLTYTPTTTVQTTANLYQQTVYNGTTLASASTSFSINGGCGNVAQGCKQK